MTGFFLLCARRWTSADLLLVALVLEEPLAVSGGDPEDVYVVSVAPVVLAVAIDHNVVDSAVGLVSSPQCTP